MIGFRVDGGGLCLLVVREGGSGGCSQMSGGWESVSGKEGQ